MLYGESLLWATIISFGLAYLTRVNALRPIVTFFTTWRFMGLTGLVFYFMVVTSDGHQLKLAILVFSISTFLLTSMVSIVQKIPDAQFDYARTLRMGEAHIIWHVVIRGTMDQALNALRENAAIGWMQLAAVEALSRSEGGIGMLLWNQQKHLKLEHILAILLLFLILGLLVNAGLAKLREVVCPHAALKTAGGR
jgi:NitT/TauT family transport system permease protein